MREEPGESTRETDAGAEDRVRDLGSLPAEQLETEVVTLASRLAAGTYELLRLVGELDVRGTWAHRGSLSCAAWLADVCDVEGVTARTQVRVARAMRSHPVLDAAMATGDVSFAKARVLVPHLAGHNVSALVDLATVTPSGRLGAAIAAWSRCHEDPDEIDRRHHRERSVSWRTDADGMVTLTARLPPEQAGAVIAVVDREVMAGRAPAGASLRQQRADTLVHRLTAGGGAVTAEVVIHVRGDEPCRLADGTPVSDHAVAGLLDDAFVSLLLHDADRWPVDASPRRRSPTRRQRRVLDEREQECAQPGCSAPVVLQYDHVEPYEDDGPTVLANLRRLCGPHNRARSRRRAGGPR